MTSGLSDKVGVLISNLGTPGSFNPGDVGKYLSEFLMDPYVIQTPRWLRSLFVKRMIVPLRKKKTASKYRKIWGPEGSPLMVQTKRFSEALQRDLGHGYKVTFAMRYGQPGFLKAKEELSDCRKVIFFPQYPQYAESTVETSLRHFYRYFSKEDSRVIPPYYNNSKFTDAYTLFLKPYVKDLDFDYLLMSFHGLPVSHIKKKDPTGQYCLLESFQGVSVMDKGFPHKKGYEKDSFIEKREPCSGWSKNRVEINCCLEVPENILRTCYRAQCFYSARVIALSLGLSEKEYGVGFQSRLGPNKWIGPGTEELYNALIKKGFKKLAIVCPGFSVDGLETLEEIAIKGKKLFLQKGGEDFYYIPCFNDSFHWVRACVKIVKGIE